MSLLPPEQNQEDRLLLIDGHAIIYRAFYAIRGLATSGGFPTNAIYGYLQSLEKVMEEFPSAYFGLALDSKGKTVRHEEYEKYKENRPEMPEELACQIPKIEEISRNLGYNVLRREGYEADDVIAKLVEEARKRDLEVLIFTGDKDLAQLADEKVKLLDTRNNEQLELMEPEDIEEKYGVPPGKIKDYLALIGDTSDNIPGVPQIGQVRAKRLLNQFDSLDEILANLDSLSSKRARNNLKKHADEAKRGRELITLRKNFDLPVGIDDLKIGSPNLPRLRDIFKELEMSSFLEDLDPPKSEINWKLIKREDDLDSLVERLAREGEFSFDIETDNLNPINASPVGISFALDNKYGYYLPIEHQKVPTLSRSTVVEQLKPLFENSEIGKIGQNLKYDGLVLKGVGIDLSGITFDAMIASYLLKPTKRRHNLKEITEIYLGREMGEFDDLFSSSEEKDITSVPIDDLARYAVEDATIIWDLKQTLEGKLEDRRQIDLFRQIELPLINVLRDMEHLGIKLDRTKLAEGKENIETRLEGLQEEISRLAGEDINPKSPKQVRRILFDKLDLPVIERTKTGPSTNAKVLEELSEKHPLPEKIIEYRELSKLLNTYVETLPGSVNPKTGRIHTSFNQTATATGRLSSSDPNLQNIPKGSQLGNELRKAFVAPAGAVFIGADYSQVELRILAHLSEDDELIKTFREGEDLHSKTAAEIFGVSRSEVDEKMRDRAKRVNFGIVYGITEYGLSRDLGVSQQEAKEYIEGFFELYPATREFIDQLVHLAKEKGYAATMFNRRRNLPNINSDNWQRRNYDRRNAINTPIQGSAADLIKIAMIDVYEEIDQGNIRGDLLLQIHDELILESARFHCHEDKTKLKQTMENSLDLKATLKVDLAVGEDWSEL